MQHSLWQWGLLVSLCASLTGCGSSGGGDDVKWGSSSDLNGKTKTYLLDSTKIDPNAWTKPKGVGSAFGGFVPQFLIGVSEESGELTATVTTAIKGKQDMCTPTQKTKIEGDYPDSTISISEFRAHLTGEDEDHNFLQAMATIHDLSLKNLLPGSSEDGSLAGVLDARDILPLYYSHKGATKDEFCTDMKNYNAKCTDCSFDGETYCEQVQADQIEAHSSDVTIKSVSDSDVSSSCS